MEPPEELVDRELSLTVQLPGGQEQTATVHGSKPVLDVLVTLCAQHHLNPSDYLMELVSTNQNQLKYKPSSLIGSLDAEKVVLKPKGADENNRRRPYIPEATVRLMVNYKKSHKAVVRVNPRVPLSQLMAVVCDKCEFDPETTILLKTSQSEDTLDLTKSLNEHGLRELYAKDTKVIVIDAAIEASTPTHKGCVKEKQSPGKEKRQTEKEKNGEKENKGFLSLFRKKKKKPEQGVSVSAPTSPVLDNQRVISSGSLGTQSDKVPTDMPKKRPAPLPPMTTSRSFPNSLNGSPPANQLPGGTPGQGVSFTHVSSTESSLKRNKRRAPPPPPLNVNRASDDTCTSGAMQGFSPLEDIEEEANVALTLTDSQLYQYLAAHSPPTPSPPPISDKLNPLSSTGTHPHGDVSSEGNSPSHAAQCSVLVSTPACGSLACSPGSDHRRAGTGPSLRPVLQRDALTTLTIGSHSQHRRSRRLYEVPLTLQAPDGATQTGEGQSPSTGSPKGTNPELPKLEMQKVESGDSSDLGLENLKPDSSDVEDLESDCGLKKVVEFGWSEATNIEPCNGVVMTSNHRDGHQPHQDEETNREKNQVLEDMKLTKRKETEETERRTKQGKIVDFNKKETKEEKQENMFESAGEKVVDIFSPPPPPVFMYEDKEWEMEREEEEEEKEDEEQQSKSDVSHSSLDQAILPPEASPDPNPDGKPHSKTCPKPHLGSMSNPGLSQQLELTSTHTACEVLTHPAPDSHQANPSIDSTVSSPGAPSSAPKSYSSSPSAASPTPDPRAVGGLSLFALAVAQKAQELKTQRPLPTPHPARDRGWGRAPTHKVSSAVADAPLYV